MKIGTATVKERALCEPSGQAAAVLLRTGIVVPRRSEESVKLQREASRVALAKCAELCGAPSTGWLQDTEGRPLPLNGWHWSISHKHEWVAAVIANQAVGIDIEKIEPRRDESLFNAVADADEWAILGERSWENFLRLWTAKEAVLKANGVGIGQLRDCRLSAPLHNQVWRFDFGKSLWLVEHNSVENAIAAVALKSRHIAWSGSY